MVASFSVVTVIANCTLDIRFFEISHKIYILAVLSALLCYGGNSGVCCTVQDVYRFTR
jgi:hypothetical protein